MNDCWKIFSLISVMPLDLGRLYNRIVLAPFYPSGPLVRSIMLEFAVPYLTLCVMYKNYSQNSHLRVIGNLEY